MSTNKELISQSLARHMYSCIEEYELIKSKKSEHFKTVKSFCLYYKFSHQNFMKIYHRYKQNPVLSSVIPQKRGPKYKTRRYDLSIEEKILSLRRLGNNRYDIRDILHNQQSSQVPCATTIYNICKRHGLNRLGKVEKETKRKIIMEKVGELFVKV